MFVCCLDGEETGLVSAGRGSGAPPRQKRKAEIISSPVSGFASPSSQASPEKKPAGAKLSVASSTLDTSIGSARDSLKGSQNLKKKGEEHVSCAFWIVYLFIWEGRTLAAFR